MIDQQEIHKCTFECERVEALPKYSFLSVKTRVMCIHVERIHITLCHVALLRIFIQSSFICSITCIKKFLVGINVLKRVKSLLNEK